MASYSPDLLPPTQWVADNLDNPSVRIVEVDVDTTAYDTGHIPGAVGWNWRWQLQDRLERNIASKRQIEKLMSDSGIRNDTTIVLYGDNNNLFAAYGLWLLQHYGHEDVRLMDGGRKKWIAEKRPFTRAAPKHATALYKARKPDPSSRALRDHVLECIGNDKVALVDVRSAMEFSGEMLTPDNLLQEGSQRGGHIPGAKNITWFLATNEDGTFKSADELAHIYLGHGVTPDKEIITYCRIGERSAHTWFVLLHLLNYPNVRNYDGSWTEWGSLIGVPIKRSPHT